MATTRRRDTTTRKAAGDVGRRIPTGTVTRLHATTALSRIMRGDHEGARELLSARSPADVADIARAAEQLAATARLAYANLTDGRPVPALTAVAATMEA